MVAFSISLLVALAATVYAQTPQGFTPAVTQNLKVTYAANDITPPGKAIARPGAKSTPRR